MLVTNHRVLLKDVLTIYTENKKLQNSIGSLHLYTFESKGQLSVSIMKIIQLILDNFPDVCVEYKQGKSQYVDNIQCPSYQGGDDQVMQRQICESPSYGNILYDSDNEIYYRIVYIPQEVEAGVEALTLLRSGRKQFSIQIFDKQLTMIGEHVFPPYTYNSRLCFVTKGKLYISTNHVMNPDYSDDVLSFQMFELVDKAGGIR